MKRKILVIFLIITGIAFILYPVISNYINEFNQTKLIVNYKNEVEKLSDKEKSEKIKNAEKYNKDLEKDIHIDVSLEGEKKEENPSYLNLLDVGDEMGYINIPKIEVNLPIYHGTSNNVLKSGVGHLESSSLPVGGKGTHAVLAGHTGLASGKIFDNIDKLEVGDVFYINILNKTLEYKVDNITKVEPDDTDTIKVDPEKDYVTLVTCTPKFINTHRLLVRGERVQDIEKTEKLQNTNDKKETENLKKQDVELQGKFTEVVKENKKELVIIGVILVLIAIFIWSHKFIKID